MRPSEIKDKILSDAYTNSEINSEHLAQTLGVHHHTVYTLCLEMVKANHLRLLSRSWSEIHNNEMNCIAEIRPEGKHFYDTTSYQKEEKKTKEHWSKKSPLLYEIVKWFILLVLGYAIRMLTEPKNNHSTSKPNTVNTTDTATKKQ